MQIDILDRILIIFNICIFFGLAVIFWVRAYRKSETSSQKWFNAYYGLFMLCFGLMRLIALIDKMGWIVGDSIFLWKLEMFAAFGGIIALLFVIERYSIKTNYLLTIIQSIGLVLVMIFPVSAGQFGYDARLITYILFPIGVFGILGVYIYLIIKTSGSVKLKLVSGFLGIFIIFLGLIIGTNLGPALFQFHNNLESLLLISGAILMAFNPGLTWSHTIKHLYIVHKSSSIFQYDFISSKDSVDSASVARGITGVIGLLQEMTRSQKYLKVVDQRDIKVLLEYGKFITAVLFSTLDLKMLHDQLHKLVSEIEILYSDVFPTWSGSTEIFLPIKKIVENIFQLI